MITLMVILYLFKACYVNGGFSIIIIIIIIVHTKPGVTVCFRCGVLTYNFVNEVCYYARKWFVFEWKTCPVPTHPRPMCLFYLHVMHLCVCMLMRMCVFEGLCLCSSVTVYTLSARGHLD